MHRLLFALASAAVVAMSPASTAVLAEGDPGSERVDGSVVDPTTSESGGDTARPQYFTSPPIVAGQRYDHNFPDPSILRVGATYFAYASSTGGKNLPVLRSTDLFNWFPAGSGEAMPTPPVWATADPVRGQQWAPSVVALGGRYVAYSSWEISRERRCISVAYGPSPAGPFVDRGSPLQCDWDPGGSIDPVPFIDANGTPHLIWKNQGEPGRVPTSLWSRPMTSDGLAFSSTWPTILLTTELAWEQPAIENPSMVLWQGVYYLVYSANYWESSNYAMGIARCDGPRGPCVRSRGIPLIPNDANQWGPGGGSFFIDADGQLRLVYHAWNPPYSTNPQDPNCDGWLLCASQGRRAMRIAFLSVGGSTLWVAPSTPFGNVDIVRAEGEGRVTLAGWAIDPEIRDPIRVHIYANGRFVRAGTANLNRPDVGAALPRYGPNHGFSLSLNDLRPGPTEICTFAINWGWGATNPLLGCRTIVVTDNSPRGNVDLARSTGPGSVQMAGWTLDPDTTDPIRVHFYVNDRFVRATTANLNRPDVGTVFPDYGPNHGFDTTLTNLTAGTNRICAWGINTGQGYNHLLGCRTVTVPGGRPVGNVDLARSTGPGSVQMAGWTLDPDTTDPIRVHFYVNDRFVRATTANLNRPDVGTVFPGYGPNHGFDATLTDLTAGTNRICAWGINTGGNDHQLLGCRTVTVPGGRPVGNVDLARSTGPGSVQMAGWTLDPDTTDPIRVHFYVNDRFVRATTANLNRPDVGTVFPGYGPNHGFDATLTDLTAGTNRICVWGINTGGNDHQLLGCRTVTVPGDDPSRLAEDLSPSTDTTRQTPPLTTGGPSTTPTTSVQPNPSTTLPAAPSTTTGPPGGITD